MKKHDEGYVLAFVMVVITVLCLIAALLMPLSLRNLQAQNDSIRRMQDKYAAQGAIETVVAKMDSPASVSKKDNLENSLKAFLGENAVESISLSTVGVTDGANVKITSFAAVVQIASTNGSVKAEATLNWAANVAEVDAAYQITPSLLKYESYQISSGEEGPDD